MPHGASNIKQNIQKKIHKRKMKIILGFLLDANKRNQQQADRQTSRRANN